MNGPADKECIRRILDGEDELYAVIVDRYSQRVFSLIVGIVGDRASAEEVAQDVFVKVFEKLHRFRGESAFSTWLFRIAYTTAISALRGANRRETSLDEGRIAALPDTDEPDFNEGRIERMEAAIEKLPPADQALLKLFYMEERSIAEISYIVNGTQSNIKTRLHRIRCKLKILMEG